MVVLLTSGISMLFSAHLWLRRMFGFDMGQIYLLEILKTFFMRVFFCLGVEIGTGRCKIYNRAIFCKNGRKQMTSLLVLVVLFISLLIIECDLYVIFT